MACLVKGGDIDARKEKMLINEQKQKRKAKKSWHAWTAVRASGNLSITSSPINICRRTIPTAWISRWRVCRREDSFWTSLESLKTKMSMQGGIWMGWFKRLPCFRNLEFVLYKWCMWSERIGTMEIEESCIICYSSELNNFRLSSIISGC